MGGGDAGRGMKGPVGSGGVAGKRAGLKGGAPLADADAVEDMNLELASNYVANSNCLLCLPDVPDIEELYIMGCYVKFRCKFGE